MPGIGPMELVIVLVIALVVLGPKRLPEAGRSLGSKVPAAPSFDFQGTNKGDKFVPTALVLENTGVRAYLGQATRIKQSPILAAAAAIVTVEARHAAAVATLINPGSLGGTDGITPYGAFDKASSMKKILGEVGATGFIVE